MTKPEILFKFLVNTTGLGLNKKVHLFIGKPGQTLQFSGELVLKEHEMEAFKTILSDPGGKFVDAGIAVEIVDERLKK